MEVAPDKLLQLKEGLEAELERLRTWLFAGQESIAAIPPPGNDPCSGDTVAVFGQNGQTATNTADVYVQQLRTVVAKLHESALAYGLIEDDNTDKFRRGPE